MPNAFFHFIPNSPFRTKYGIFIRGNGEPQKVRKALNMAARNRRSEVKYDRDSYIPYVSNAFVNLGSRVKYAIERDDDEDVHFRYVLDTSEAVPMLRIVQARTDEIYFAGPFFQFLKHGIKHPPQRGMRPGTNPIILKKQRELKFRENYKAQHGYYPTEKPTRILKIYTPAQKKLQERQEDILVKGGRKILTKLRRSIVKKHLTKVKDHEARMLGADDPIPWYGQGPDPRKKPKQVCSECGSPDPDNIHREGCSSI